jgi:hypothetical protein
MKAAPAESSPAERVPVQVTFAKIKEGDSARDIVLDCNGSEFQSGQGLKAES